MTASTSKNWLTDMFSNLKLDQFVSGSTPFAAKIPAFSCEGLRVKSVGPLTSHNVTVSGSKSFTNRALVLAGMSSSPTILSGVLRSDDSFWGIYSLYLLGFSVYFEDEKLLIHPPTECIALRVQSDPLYFGMAGTLARFFPAVVLNLQKTFPRYPTQTFALKGTKRLSERPLSELLVSLRSLGAVCAGDSLPIQISPSNLSGSCEISGARSGQFLSGTLLAAAGSLNDIKIRRVDNLVQPDYVRMTLQALEYFGAAIVYDNTLQNFHVFPGKKLGADRFTVEADASTACYFMTFAFLHNRELTIENLGSDSLQPDVKFVEFLRILGAKITVNPKSVICHRLENPLPIDGGFSMDFNLMSDQSLTAGVLATFAQKPIEICGVGHIRHHESDRIAALCSNLTELGVQTSETDDGFVVHPAKGALCGEWKTHHDHRFAMVGFLLASMHNDIAILNPECVSKTAPDFFEVFEKNGVEFY